MFYSLETILLNVWDRKEKIQRKINVSFLFNKKRERKKWENYTILLLSCLKIVKQSSTSAVVHFSDKQLEKHTINLFITTNHTRKKVHLKIACYWYTHYNYWKCQFLSGKRSCCRCTPGQCTRCGCVRNVLHNQNCKNEKFRTRTIPPTESRVFVINSDAEKTSNR